LTSNTVATPHPVCIANPQRIRGSREESQSPGAQHPWAGGRDQTTFDGGSGGEAGYTCDHVWYTSLYMIGHNDKSDWTFGVASSLLAAEVRGLAGSPSAIDEEQSLPAYLGLLEGFCGFARDNGFEIIEVELGFSLISADRLMERAAELKRLFSPFRMVISHLPLGEINISALHPAVREAAIAETKRHIDLCRELEISAFVMHPGSFAAMPDRYAILESQTRAVAYASVIEINGYCAARGMELSIENLHCNEPLFNRPEEMEPFARAGLGIVLDTAHAAVCGVRPVEFVRRLGAHITEVHLSDAVTSDPLAHRPVGSGEADCLDVLKELEAIGFRGRVVLEVESREDVLQSVDFLRANGYLR